MEGGVSLIFDTISLLCKERNVSIARLEKECGLGNATIRGWKDSSPSLTNLKKVADYLKVDINQLIQ